MSTYNAIYIDIVYVDEETKIGFYKIHVKKGKIVINRDAFKKYEFSSPVYKRRPILLGVLHNSAFSMADNNVASYLFNQNIWGSCVLVFPHDDVFGNFTDKEFEIMSNVIKQDLILKGMNEKNIHY